MNQQIEEDTLSEAQIGRILHFVIDKGYGLECRPAIVVNDWPGNGIPGYVNLVVFIDGLNDNPKAPKPESIRWETSILPNHAVKVYRTWHWPRNCNHLVPAPEPYMAADKKRYHHTHKPDIIDIHNCYACLLIDSSKENVNA